MDRGHLFAHFDGKKYNQFSVLHPAMSDTPALERYIVVLVVDIDLVGDCYVLVELEFPCFLLFCSFSHSLINVSLSLAQHAQ